ncbi:MAG TPA: ABC transporter substrate-binding protein [bacterium]|nr:ABC transporter substrate-binding protein [bacterium]
MRSMSLLVTAGVLTLGLTGCPAPQQGGTNDKASSTPVSEGTYEERVERAKLLRKAVAYAIDRNYIVNDIMKGQGVPYNKIIPPGLGSYRNPEDTEPYDYNPTKAADLLEQAGYPEGKGLPPITMWFNKEGSHPDIAAAIQNDLKKVGINVDLRYMEWASYIEAVDAGEPQFFRMGWVMDYPDPDNWLWVLFNSANHGPAGNTTRYSNPEVDRLTNEAQRITDEAARMEMYKQAEKLILDDCPWVIIEHGINELLVQPNVQGMKFTALDSADTIGHVRFEEISLAQGMAGGKYKPPAGNTYFFPTQTNPPTLDPALVSDTTSDAICNQIFDGLLTLDDNLNIAGEIATEWSIDPDNVTYHFTLTDKAKFHNGRTVTAEDFKYSFERLLTPEVGAKRMNWVLPILGAQEFHDGKTESLEGVIVEDPTHLTIKLKEPYAPFIYHLAMVSLSVLPKEEVEKYGLTEFTNHPVGSGPFRFVSWAPNERIELTANRDYWRKTPSIDGIIYKVIKENRQQLEEYKLGNLHHCWVEPVNLWPLVQEDPELKEQVQRYDLNSLMYYGFNMEKEPFGVPPDAAPAQ